MNNKQTQTVQLMIHKLHTMSEKCAESNRQNSENDLYELYQLLFT